MANEITKVTDQNGVDHPFKDVAAFPRSEQMVTGAYNFLDTNTILYLYMDTANSKYATQGTPNVCVAKVEPNTKYKITKQAGTHFRVATSQDYPANNVAYTSTYADHTGTKIEITTGPNDHYIGVYTDVSDFPTAMVSFASNPDIASVIPFAMTNKELTDALVNKNTIITTGDDLNNFTETGLFRIYDTPTNAPESIAYATLLVHKVGSTVTEQVIFRAGTIYSRVSGSNPRQWYAWYKFTGTAL